MGYPTEGRFTGERDIFGNEYVQANDGYFYLTKAAKKSPSSKRSVGRR